MGDIVERLREDARGGMAYHELSDEAADEIEKLREALRPFEELADEGNEDQPDETKVIVQAGRSTCYWLTLKDLRRARDALYGS